MHYQFIFSPSWCYFLVSLDLSSYHISILSCGRVWMYDAMIQISTLFTDLVRWRDSVSIRSNDPKITSRILYPRGCVRPSIQRETTSKLSFYSSTWSCVYNFRHKMCTSNAHRLPIPSSFDWTLSKPLVVWTFFPFKIIRGFQFSCNIFQNLIFNFLSWGWG